MYTEQQLQQLNIHELRSLARSFGVKSPTSKKHQVLVEEILKIQEGSLKATVTTKGRPPKSRGSNFNSVVEQDNVIGVNFNYNQDSSSRGGMCLHSSGMVIGLNSYRKCYGVLRDFNGNKYLYNYTSSYQFVEVPNNLIVSHNLKPNDFIIGQMCVFDNGSAILQVVEDVNLQNHDLQKNSTDIKLQKLNYVSEEDCYNYILQTEDVVKVVLSLESNIFYINEISKKSIFLHTIECEDIKRSYNTVLDCLNLIKRLIENNKPFVLYCVNVDYVYNLLNIYFSNTNGHNNIDAGQMIKLIISNIKNYENGNLVIFEDKKQPRNEYLDAILNKYF